MEALGLEGRERSSRRRRCRRDCPCGSCSLPDRSRSAGGGIRRWQTGSRLARPPAPAKSLPPPRRSLCWRRPRAGRRWPSAMRSAASGRVVCRLSAKGPADHLAAVELEHDGEEEPAFSRLDGGHFHAPDLVRGGRWGDAFGQAWAALVPRLPWTGLWQAFGLEIKRASHLNRRRRSGKPGLEREAAVAETRKTRFRHGGKISSVRCMLRDRRGAGSGDKSVRAPIPACGARALTVPERVPSAQLA